MASHVSWTTSSALAVVDTNVRASRSIEPDQPVNGHANVSSSPSRRPAIKDVVRRQENPHVLTVRQGPQRYSGFSKSNRQPASHSERWLPNAGIPPASFSILARCSRFQVRKVVFRLVKSLSGPPEPSSRYDGPGPAWPIHPASACGGIVYPRCCNE